MSSGYKPWSEWAGYIVGTYLVEVMITNMEKKIPYNGIVDGILKLDIFNKDIRYSDIYNSWKYCKIDIIDGKIKLPEYMPEKLNIRFFINKFY